MRRLTLLLVCGCRAGALPASSDLTTPPDLARGPFELPPQPGVYGGAQSSNGLTPQNCPSLYDADLERNDSVATATDGFDDATTHDKLAICPVGDLDFYSIHVLGGHYLRVRVGYQIKFGDLDAAIVDDAGYLFSLASTPLYDSGSMSDGACVASIAPTSAGQRVYLVVYGARNAAGTTDGNAYTFKVETSMSPLYCP
jgi:hypothetical protein